MSTKLSIWLGIGRLNKGDITANNYDFFENVEVGSINGDSGAEKVKLADSLIELGELPDIDALIAQRHQELIDAEESRHQERMEELNKIQAA